MFDFFLSNFLKAKLFRDPTPYRISDRVSRTLFLSVIAAVSFAPIALSGTAMAKDAGIVGCTSKQILNGFREFGRTGKMPRYLGRWLNNPKAQYIKPWKPFDNIDYVGVCFVSSWIIRTDDGAVLIDTLYGRHIRQLIKNLKSIKINLTDIKYVLMTHGHRDHVGGAITLKPLLPNAKFVMSQKGWEVAAASAKRSTGKRRAWKMIEPEMVVKDGDIIKLGRNRFRVIETPGHTWGTVSYEYDVQEGSKTYRAITIGGLGLNAIRSSAQVEAYINSLDRIRARVRDAVSPVQVHLTTHSFSNNMDENRQKLDKRVAGEPNIFIDPQGLLKEIARMRSRAGERLVIEQKKAKQ